MAGLVMNVTIEDAFKEACTALGEGLVRERIQAQEVRRLTAENAALRDSLPVTDLDAAPTPA